MQFKTLAVSAAAPISKLAACLMCICSLILFGELQQFATICSNGCK